MSKDERHLSPPAEEADRLPLGVYTPKAGAGPADVPTNAFRPRPKPDQPQDGDEN